MCGWWSRQNHVGLPVCHDRPPERNARTRARAHALRSGIGIGIGMGNDYATSAAESDKHACVPAACINGGSTHLELQSLLQSTCQQEETTDRRIRDVFDKKEKDRDAGHSRALDRRKWAHGRKPAGAFEKGGEGRWRRLAVGRRIGAAALQMEVRSN